MPGWLIFPGGNPNAVSKRAQLKANRLADVWDDPSGKTKWPDGITEQAVRVYNHPSNGQAAVFVGQESLPHLTMGEKASLLPRSTLKAAGWFG